MANKNLYLDSATYDLKLENYNLKLTNGFIEYITQKIENILSTFQNEWFLNRDLGIPYYDRILIKNADLNDVNNIFIIALSNISEIDEILEFNTEYNNQLRLYTINFKVRVQEEIIEGTVEV